jgi:hypothetical protein
MRGVEFAELHSGHPFIDRGRGIIAAPAVRAVAVQRNCFD